MSLAVFKARKRYFPPQKPTPRAAFLKSLIFQGFAPGCRKPGRTLRALGRFGCAQHKLEKRTVSGIALARIARIWPKVQVRPLCRAGACGCEKRWRARCGASRRRSLRPIIARKLTVLARIGAS
jgi:hypothetical protein